MSCEISFVIPRTFFQITFVSRLLVHFAVGPKTTRTRDPQRDVDERCKAAVCKTMMKLIVVIFLVLAKIPVIGFDLIFAVKYGLSACGYSFQEVQPRQFPNKSSAGGTYLMIAFWVDAADQLPARKSLSKSVIGSQVGLQRAPAVPVVLRPPQPSSCRPWFKQPDCEVSFHVLPRGTMALGHPVGTWLGR